MKKGTSSNSNSNPQIDSNGAATWSIPISVTVQLGNPKIFQNDSPELLFTDPKITVIRESIGPEQFKLDVDYSNRKGYDPNFLGVQVDLPKLSPSQRKIAAINKIAKEGENENELKYQHFSILMNGSRRLAFFTAVNIDGASVVNINRKTGEIKRVEDPSFEAVVAYEEWFDDERINESERSTQDLYNEPFMREYFQRGHLVKRTDPSWATPERAMRGQADSFHFTNCAPQHEGFNPIAKRWAGIENWITDVSDEKNIRLTVFSGPVFKDDDPEVSYIKIPMKYWKVIVWMENSQLKATGILADQTDLVQSSLETWKKERFADLPNKFIKVYHCSLSEIQTLTDLDLQGLLGYDTFKGSPELLNAKRFIPLINSIARENLETIDEELYAVKSYKAFEKAFKSYVTKAISEQSKIPIENIVESINLRNDLGFKDDQADKWAEKFRRVIAIYVVNATVSRGECIDQDTVKDCIELLRKKIKPERLYILAMVKKWIDEIRVSGLPGPWYVIKNDQKLVDDLELSEKQINKIPEEFTEIGKQLKSSAIIAMSDIKKDKIADKTVSECADYILSKAGVSYS